MRITREQRVLGDLVAGSLVGSALLLSGVPADVDALAVEAVRALRWEVGALERYLNAHLETRIIMQQHLSRDLAGRMDALSGGSSTTALPNRDN